MPHYSESLLKLGTHAVADWRAAGSDERTKRAVLRSFVPALRRENPGFDDSEDAIVLGAAERLFISSVYALDHATEHSSTT